MKEEKSKDRWRWWLTKHAHSPQLRKALTLLHRNLFCCGFDQAPFPESAFKTCFPFFEHLVRNMTSLLGKGIYKASSSSSEDDLDAYAGEIQGYKLHVHSKLIFSLSFVKMKKHFDLVEKDIDKMNEDSSPKLGSVFLYSFFGPFNLQLQMSEGLVFSLAISILCASIVLFLTIQDVVVTVLAIIVISGSLLTTTAAITLIGWELGILESISITLSVGLSVDFAIHYGVTFASLRSRDKEVEVGSCHVSQQTKETLSYSKQAFRSVFTAISMAALTTFFVGVCMLPSKVLIYRQFGVFLILVMTSSWIFATFFFLPLCGTFEDILRMKSEKPNGKEGKQQTRQHRSRGRLSLHVMGNSSSESRETEKRMTYESWIKSLEDERK